jgi:hypothetical protein
MLEPYAVKVASTVLRRGGGRNLFSLFDNAEYFFIKFLDSDLVKTENRQKGSFFVVVKDTISISKT